jgi:hypothetical protein
MDFFRVCTRESRKKGGPLEVYADYTVGRSKDLMVQGGAFYAVWDEEKGLWSRDEYDVQILVDQMLRKEVERLTAEGVDCDPKYLGSFDNGRWEKFKKFIRSVSDNSHPLDTKVVFADAELKRSDYASRKLPYSLSPGSISAYDELVSRLYSPKERAKIEWSIGAVLTGDAKKIQKFIVFYGSYGTGKSTIMDIITKLLGGKVKEGGYVAIFDAQALTGNGNTFATAAFKDNPLVAIQQDGDLSKIETNSRLNSIVSHEDIPINEKFKATYDNKINAFLFMGTNKPVQITDAKSGLIRRLIDVNPTTLTFEPNHYFSLISRVDFELSAIAHHCIQVYREMGKNAYGDYIPENMMMKTDAFRNFVEEYFDIFKEQNGTSLSQAWKMYKAYCEEAQLPYKMTMIKFREELKNYFDEFHDRIMEDGSYVRSVYKKFKAKQFKAPIIEGKKKTFSLVMDDTESLLDELYSGLPAQYGNSEENPKLYWDNSERLDKKGESFIPKPSQVVSTVLGDLDTTKLHFVKVPEHHIVIDFDLKDDDGNKSLERNLEAASDWPATYAEISKSGGGVHLHYIWDGDTSELSNIYSEGVEIKVYHGNMSLRRKLTKCNNITVTTISSGLPFKEKETMQQTSALRSEKGLRDMIIRNLRKEIHPGTKPSIDFIEHLLKEAKKAGYPYDVSDLLPKVMAFAVNSTNKSDQCLKAVARMKDDFKSEMSSDEVEQKFQEITAREERVVFFDCEVYPNLFVVCWKYHGEDTSIVRMIDPSPAEVERLLTNFKLVGFNNRGYDNHILWARMLGASVEDLYKLSQKIIVENDDNAKYGEAWSASYADVYDFSSDKKTLKKWQIELGIHHVEMDIPWDQPVKQEDIIRVVDYCCNDVLSLEAVFNHCKQDFVARQILADLSGLTVNSSTRQHAIKIMFGNERNPQSQFVYTDLSELFPGYKFDPYNKTEKSTYKGQVVGEGGYVYAEPGMYEDVAVLDIASMHPHSIKALNLFGPYTEKYVGLMNTRLAMKNGDKAGFARALPGVAWPETEEDAKALSDALKLVLNSIYGYTAATFMNPFRDKRNVDNIVAKRGSLFMVDLVEAVQAKGFTVAHVKTDSIKIPNATPEIIKFVQDFGAGYGYTFEHEATYKKMCLVNDAVLIAYVGWNQKGKPEHWKAVGKEFQQPYVFKTLFTDEPISFSDLCETKQVVKGVMHLRYPNGVSKIAGDDSLTFDKLSAMADIPDFVDHHIGRSGLFVPINPNQDMFQGGQLLRINDGKEYAVPGTKGYLWAEAESVRVLQDGAIDRMVFERIEDAVEGTGSIVDVINMKYYQDLVEDAAQSIAKYGDFEGFVK